MTIRYHGTRLPEGCCVQIDDGSKIPPLLPPRHDLANHSPTGFEWGYAGSGPAQLALAILAHAIGDDKRAVRLHQSFKREYIATLPRDDAAGWFMWADEVRTWAEKQP